MAIEIVTDEVDAEMEAAKDIFARLRETTPWLRCIVLSAMQTAQAAKENKKQNIETGTCKVHWEISIASRVASDNGPYSLSESSRQEQTHNFIDTSLERFEAALSHLPDNIPLGNQRYNFEHFSPDPVKIELYGTSEAAVNHELEVTSAPCPFEYEERGPGLIASNEDSDIRLDGSVDLVDEGDPGYLRCSNQVFVGSEDARLDGPELLNLLSDNLAIDMEVQNQSRTPGPSSEVADGGPVAWKFSFSQTL
ncbi:hypothetical protein DFJ58DRAFT_917524 [Suillus subalutaceus]|uniref:uncharacterized protein n=1 Tax=Suillus subalutaceus TaxID=48586 RepID=UPI001B87C406|nr:uncharacterized protein DFJ58DRAFT_917524 [Suillus subalutaceus]KAG1836883.1 hypothetical protein DFJ58DRAFT_917524 [Suillus subalutaceus]